MESQAKTFVLTKTKTWRRQVRVFTLNKDKKYEERLLQFTTEHKVNAKLRSASGRRIGAEFVTSDPVIIDALYRDTAYGKDFIEKGDPTGKLKKDTLIINEDDKQIVAMRGLFASVGLEMDENLPLNVLKEQYEIHISALSGKHIGKSTATEIHHTPVNVQQGIADLKQAARDKYEEEYGDPVPQIVYDDIAFLDGMSNPKFNAEKYIAQKIKDAAEEEAALLAKENVSPSQDVPVTDDKETLHKKYFDKFEKKVPNMKANDLGWIKDKLESQV